MALAGVYWRGKEEDDEKRVKNDAFFGCRYGDGLKGIFIVEDPEDPWLGFYEADEALLFYEWTAMPVLSEFIADMRAPFTPSINRWDGGLVNGIPCVDTSGQPTEGYVVEVEAGKTSRLRLARHPAILLLLGVSTKFSRGAGQRARIRNSLSSANRSAEEYHLMRPCGTHTPKKCVSLR